MNTPLVSLRNFSKAYQMGPVTVCALQDVSLDIYPGEYVSIMGPSGCGKSTLLNLLGCLDRPTAGRYLLAGEDVSELDDDALSAIARSLANDPLIILADEPTGNLDSSSGADLLQLFDELNAQRKTLIMVTHDTTISNRAARTVRLRDGQIESDHRR